MKSIPVILVDDEPDIRDAWAETLALEVYEPFVFSDGNEALKALNRDWPGIVVTDLRMPGMNGTALLEAVREIDRDIPVIIITGHGDVPMAVSAVRSGAYDFIEKPVEPDVLLAAVERAARMRQLVLQNRALKSGAGERYALEKHLIGNSEAIRLLRKRIAAIALADVNTVIYGETGSGKEVVATALHELGQRREGPFVALNCGALPDTLIASELFGHEPGAFTGADRRRIGRLEQASGGTLFLDEIESMPLAHQTQLLRALQSQTITRLGGRDEIGIDVRVVAAAKKDLEAASEEGSFRADLYYRIAVATLSIPPLRKRPEDVPLLFMHYAQHAARRVQMDFVEPDHNYLDALRNRPWKGNVRELINLAERYALGIDGEARSLEADQLSDGLAEQMDTFEKRVLAAALRKTGGQVQRAADLLRIPRKKLYLRMQRHGLSREEFLSKDRVKSDT
ncbi:sigma-54 dependent transcriptional regulator [Nitratireductor sp. GISD-1A_MAKvit]|uniref:sigma-54-dependent transcriptional regulator n=1 Tax=Nitratireductor sp. GISD-1A_MAKvit TaxID=3234198 RepID=UPI003465C6FE